MYHKNLYIIFTILFFRFADAQVTQEWLRSFPGGGWNLCTDRSGNIIVLGEHSGLSVYKYNQQGALLWSKKVANPLSIPIMITDTSGNILVCGYPFLTKLSPAGDSLWEVSISNMESGKKYLAADIQGNIYVYNGSNHLQLRKFDSSGILQWSRRYDPDAGSSSDASFGNKRIQIDDIGNIYVTGTVYKTNTNEDIVTIKYNTFGDSLWTRVFDGGGAVYDRAVGMSLDESNNIYVAGVKESVPDYFSEILKYTNNGTLLWTRFERNTYGGLRDLVCQNGFLTFTSISHYSPADWSTTSRYTYAGDSVWSRSYSGSDSNLIAYRLFVDGNNCSYIAGNINPVNGISDLAIVKYNNDGSISWTKKYSPPFPSSYPFNDFILDKFSNPILLGKTKQSQDTVYATTIKYSQTIGIENIGSEIPIGVLLKQNFPNPFNPVTNIEFAIPSEEHVELIVYNILGQIVSVLVNQVLKTGEYRYTWDALDYSSGVYFYELRTADNVERKKMVLVK